LKRKKNAVVSPAITKATNGLPLLRRRSRSDWAGIHLTDAFKPNLDYFHRIPAERMFYQAARKIQILAAAESGDIVDGYFQPNVKPQLAPCYTSYPPSLAAHAAIGLTGFLEFQSRSRSTNALFDHAAEAKRLRVERDSFANMANIVSEVIAVRLLLEDLSRVPSMAAVEMYRLFASCQHSLQFGSVADILRTVILFGDLLPEWDRLKIHSLTRTLLKELTSVSAPFFNALSILDREALFSLGVKWSQDICELLAKYLPQAANGPSQEKEQNPVTTRSPGWLKKMKKAGKEKTGNGFPALNDPQPPALFEPLPLDQAIAHSLWGQRYINPRLPFHFSHLGIPAGTVLQEFQKVMEQACRQNNHFQDMRFDVLEKILRNSAFQAGPIEGDRIEGQDVYIPFGDQNAIAGQIFDGPLGESSDDRAYRILLEESKPAIEALKRVLYPSRTMALTKERRRTNGALDPARLAYSPFSSTLYQHYKSREQRNKRGVPVVLIACDASGSVNAGEMKMAKILTAAWLISGLRQNVEIVAGVYHSEIINGVESPLVQWIYHRRKTPATGKKGAVRTLLTLPSVGTGVQSDALSISFMIQEAKLLAKGEMIYLILISDCQWNRSLGVEPTGEKEMCSFFHNLLKDPSRRIHITLAALGSPSRQIENMMDKVIFLNYDKQDPGRIAAEIGAYVASVVKERRKKSNATFKRLHS
jgi:hypothetical protein